MPKKKGTKKVKVVAMKLPKVKKRPAKKNLNFW